LARLLQYSDKSKKSNPIAAHPKQKAAAAFTDFTENPRGNTGSCRMDPIGTEKVTVKYPWNPWNPRLLLKVPQQFRSNVMLAGKAILGYKGHTNRETRDRLHGAAFVIICAYSGWRKQE
jgi:hypothetical protein